MIGASNREDMIDPAILRPGRLDVKIKIERPDAEAAQDIYSKYLIEELPIHADDLAEFGGDRAACIKAMIEKVVDRMYAEIDDNRFLEVTYANGDKEVMYFKDFNSGAMIQNVVDRAKKNAIKAVLETGQRGLRIQHLLDSIVDEFAENEDLPNTTNPDDWARISGKKGERIVYIRTLVTGKSSSCQPGHRHRIEPGSVPVGLGFSAGDASFSHLFPAVAERTRRSGAGCARSIQVGVAAGQAHGHVGDQRVEEPLPVQRVDAGADREVQAGEHGDEQRNVHDGLRYRDVDAEPRSRTRWLTHRGRSPRADQSTATSSGTATMPSARKNANSPAVKKTTWMACDTTITATTLTCSAHRQRGAHRLMARLPSASGVPSSSLAGSGLLCAVLPKRANLVADRRHHEEERDDGQESD